MLVYQVQSGAACWTVAREASALKERPAPVFGGNTVGVTPSCTDWSALHEWRHCLRTP